MTAYYNEIDPFAAAWLRELIRAGHIAPGEVDERSIEEVKPDDLKKFTQCHFFAGIGAWSYALRNAGWPDDRPVWTGSCPCQPFSAAGKQGGTSDERHLWPHWHHLIRERRPPIVFGEQVASKDGLGWLDLVHSDLEGEGYAVGAADLCAAGVGAPHIRQRLWFVGEALDHAALDGRLEWRAKSSGRGVVGGCGSGELAISDGRQRDRLADGEGRERNGPTTGWQQSDGEPERRGATGKLAAADDARSQGRIGGWDGAGECVARAGGVELQEQPGPVNGFWRSADWLYCRDGKWRPVEPSTFPLAHGTPARVGRLRGYGNAIVAEAARTFIETYLDAAAQGG